ncbi:MAG: cyclic pyranopterin monophosphate synthase MoaC [Bdellovibrionaceae bacterium]|nr:cyclic pyranopterin monophosphate synthase MoaC [Bdellovibrionales bacterium]MCB9085058.1 cyclic pyranopterin monophosphate synthase MoaC [Pseudobdellovibrionaceae bacterium]
MLTHLDKKNQPTMVDVSEKTATLRTAWAQSKVWLPAEVRALICDGEIQSKKGPVFQTAVIAGTMGAKNTSAMIPFCHPLPLESCKIEVKLDDEGQVVIDCRVKVHHKTGVEMEALAGATIAALTVYDMLKAASKDMRILETRLVEKTGGKSDFVSPL